MMVLSWILVLKLVPGDPGLSAGSNSKEGSEDGNRAWDLCLGGCGWISDLLDLGNWNEVVAGL